MKREALMDELRVSAADCVFIADALESGSDEPKLFEAAAKQLEKTARAMRRTQDQKIRILTQGTRWVGDAHNVAGAGATPAPAPILPQAQSSRGISQSRPYPARPPKVMESAGHLTKQGAAPDGKARETEGTAAAHGRASGCNL